MYSHQLDLLTSLKMSKLVGIFACFLIVALDVTAGILGIKAEAAQNQEKHLRLWIFECKEPSHDAYILGLWAASLLGIAHVLANLLGGCNVCTQQEFQKASPSKQLSVVCLFFTWIILAVGLSMLVIADRNNLEQQIKGIMWFHSPQFLVNWRDIVYGTCPVLCCILCYFHFYPPCIAQDLCTV